MKPSHPSAGQFSRSGFFDGLGRKSRWEEKFKRLLAYKGETGHCNVPQSYSDKQLGTWVSSQRAYYKKDTLDADYVERLNAVGFVWRLRGATAG